MKKLPTLAALATLIIAGVCPSLFAVDVPIPVRFVFGQGGGDGIKPTVVTDTSVYSATSGWGFDMGSKQDPTGKPFYFSVGVPEGNYKVTVTFGGTADSNVTVKAENRRLMLEDIHTKAGESRTESFTVNVRRPQISTGGSVGLDPRENGSLSWDDKLTLAFSGDHVAISQILIDKTTVPTIFCLGDSTVVDQAGGGGSWAQSLPRWFTADVAVANHAESGETLKGFRRPVERRWDKVVSQLKPGDYVFMQFGTNDSKNRGPNNIYADEDFSMTYAPADTEFKDLLIKYAGEAKEKGATAVMVSCMARRTDSMTNGSLLAYAKAALAAGKEFGCPAIDLNSMNLNVNQALGATLVARAYNDGTHPSAYGGYLLSRCIVEGIKADKLDIAKYLRPDAGTFDPTHPAPMPDVYKPAVDAPTGGGGRGGRGGAATPPATTRGG